MPVQIVCYLLGSRLSKIAMISIHYHLRPNRCYKCRLKELSNLYYIKDCMYI